MAEDPLRQRVKAELRKRLSGVRNALPSSACAERSSRICAALLALEPFAKAGTAALFWPIENRHEVDLRALDALLRERGVRIAYPSVAVETGAMTFHFVDHPETMEERIAYGVRLRQAALDQPPVSPGELDIIVVPALAVDPSGHRIGYGAGCYDRTLPQFAPPATSVAVAFDFQVVVEVPCTPHDVPVDFVVTDERTLKCPTLRSTRSL
jgi:5-formyltetrahydrofolate cyclo-ligase